MNHLRSAVLVLSLGGSMFAGINVASAAEPGQSAKAAPFCVDLSKYCTAQLTNSLNSPAHVAENDLASFPKGRQSFAGVPFQVDCVLQVSGKKLEEWGRKEFPKGIKVVELNRSFSRIHLLHGAGGVYDSDGVTVGRLVLHYADKSEREIEIRNGVHVRDWWGDPTQAITDSNSSLAWTGTNPALKKYGGEKPGSLRIYKTTFQNPQPGVVVTSADFISAMNESSPFLLGLTVE